LRPTNLNYRHLLVLFTFKSTYLVKPNVKWNLQFTVVVKLGAKWLDWRPIESCPRPTGWKTLPYLKYFCSRKQNWHFRFHWENLLNYFLALILVAIQIIRDTLGLEDSWQCHQMTQGGRKRFVKVSRDFFPIFFPYFCDVDCFLG